MERIGYRPLATALVAPALAIAHLQSVPVAMTLPIPGERPPPSVTRSGKSVRAGRNDSCPCGSGRKYKKCCHPIAIMRAKRAKQ